MPSVGGGALGSLEGEPLPESTGLGILDQVGSNR
jgi:hypothetical protein